MHIACKKAFAKNKNEIDPKKIDEMIARGKSLTFKFSKFLNFDPTELLTIDKNLTHIDKIKIK